MKIYFFAIDHDVGEIARAKNVQVARVNFRAGH